SAFDSAGHTVTSIKIKEPVTGATNGSFNLVASSSASPFDFTFTPSAGKHTYYVYVTLNSGDEMWSAPIWINQGGSPDFSISAAPASQTVTAGGSASYTTTISALSGFAGTVNLSISGLPGGATANFNPASVAGAGNSTLSVATSSTTPAGNYTLTITGTSGTLNHSTTVALQVHTLTPESSFSATPASQPLTAGIFAYTTLFRSALSGFAGTVNLSISGLPGGATASFNPASVAGAGTSALSVATSSTTPAGNYTLTITG